MKKLLILFIFLCATQFALAEKVDRSNEQMSQTLITKAKSANDRAKKLKNEWRGTGKLIKKAKNFHKKKNYTKSIELATEALNQANMAIQQHNKQKNSYHYFE
tara:strand:+ start:482 stop:790 length:309 start_codon:yes stop_codon:yes gene_type:complete